MGSAWRVSGCILGLAVLAGGLARPAAAQDAYFRRTKSDANVYVAPVASPIQKVAVMPFKAPTELIGSSVSDIFVTELLRAARYTLVERGQIAQVLGETELALSGLSDSAAIEAGKMLGADGVILGTVDEYSTVAYRGRSYPVVGASIRLIDCDSGRVMWSVGHARRAEDPMETLSGHGRVVVHEMVSALVQNWRVQRQVARPESPPEEEEEAEAAYAATDESAELVGYDAPVEDPVPAEAPVESAPALEPPAAFTLSDFGLREVVLTWTPPPDRALQYRVERAEALEGPFATVATLPAARGTFTDAGQRNAPLEDAANYYYRLVAIDRVGLESEPSAVQESMTAPPPDPPAGLQAETPAARAVRLEWEASASDGVVNYLVERALSEDEPVFAEAGETADTSFAEGGTAASPLRDDTAYLYRVRAVNRVGAAGEPSEPVEIRTRPPPAAPEDPVANSGEVRCVPLSWAEHPEEDVVRYDIYRAENEMGPFELLDSVTGRENTSYLDGESDPGKLPDEQAYYYCIRAINTVGAESDDSEVVTATTRPLPPTVAELTAATGLPRKVALEWAVSPDEKVVGYDLARAEEDGDFGFVARVDGRENTAYEDTGGESTRFLRAAVKTPLKDGTRYSYQVRAVNTAGSVSEWSEAAAATTKVIPGTPRGLKASEGRAGAIDLAWSANKEQDLAEYAVSWSTLPDRNFTEAGRIAADAELSFRQENLGPALVRYYRVKAIDVDGLESEWSAPVDGSTKPLPAPPSALAVEWADDGARLQWRASPQKDIARYRIVGKKLFGQEELGTATEPEFFFPSETLVQKKTVVVIAVDEDGLESPPSAPLEILPPK